LNGKHALYFENIFREEEAVAALGIYKMDNFILLTNILFIEWVMTQAIFKNEN
jgi:hypothetical protein